MWCLTVLSSHTRYSFTSGHSLDGHMKIEIGPKRRGDYINGPLYRLRLGDQYIDLTPDELSKLTYLIDCVYNADITVEMEVIRTLEKVGTE